VNIPTVFFWRTWLRVLFVPILFSGGFLFDDDFWSYNVARRDAACTFRFVVLCRLDSFNPIASALTAKGINLAGNACTYNRDTDGEFLTGGRPWNRAPAMCTAAPRRKGKRLRNLLLHLRWSLDGRMARKGKVNTRSVSCALHASQWQCTQIRVVYQELRCE
jgi:hypothetical protein